MTFWDELLRLAESASPPVRREIFTQALYHRDESEGQADTWCARERFLADLEHGKYDSLPGRHIVALTSRVRVHRNQPELHIPMVDFRLESDPKNDRTSYQNSLSALGTPGFLVNSGRSYHFYGNTPVDRDEFWCFLGRAQLMSYYADQRWIGHQLIAGRRHFTFPAASDGENAIPRLVAPI